MEDPSNAPIPPTNVPPNEPPQPAAYDREGRPLYATPPAASSYGPQPAPQFVHLSRAVSPAQQEISNELKAKHDQSARDYPFLNLSDAEFIVSAVRRHPIGLAFPVIVTIFLVAVVGAFTINYPLIVSNLGLIRSPAFGVVALCGGLLTLLLLIGGYVAVWVYTNNKFFLTNESVIQEIQTSLFAHNEQTVSLANIEDASFTQTGILQMMFNYGSIRLSTEGDETTYQLHFVSQPKQQIAILNNAVEAFKNGRPVDN
ncbi:MAG: PH domain-containing protein [Candidatus Saccharimonadales bacterium]